MNMRNIVTIPVVVAWALVAGVATAQPFALVDAGRNSFGAGAGSAFGDGKLQPGFLVDVFHSYDMERVRPDTEAYGELAWTLPSNWYFMGFLGGGATFKGERADVDWSARSFLVLTQTTPVAFRTSTFVMWTPRHESWLIEQRVGPSVKLHDTSHRLFPYLALDVTTPGIKHRADVGVSPGCTFIMNF
ncbi:MAG: hypothetical protein PHS79_05045 [Patescibacteria group bacterium]|nr:hypothetical protein [Patescibacteria group bacterium]